MHEAAGDVERRRSLILARCAWRRFFRGPQPSSGWLPADSPGRSLSRQRCCSSRLRCWSCDTPGSRDGLRGVMRSVSSTSARGRASSATGTRCPRRHRRRASTSHIIRTHSISTSSVAPRSPSGLALLQRRLERRCCPHGCSGRQTLTRSAPGRKPSPNSRRRWSGEKSWPPMACSRPGRKPPTSIASFHGPKARRCFRDERRPPTSSSRGSRSRSGHSWRLQIAGVVSTAFWMIPLIAGLVLSFADGAARLRHVRPRRRRAAGAVAICRPLRAGGHGTGRHRTLARPTSTPRSRRSILARVHATSESHPGVCRACDGARPSCISSSRR